MTSEERRLAARIAAHERWAHEPDRSAATAPARAAALERFERAVDPSGTMPADERARRAEHLRKAYFSRLALKSARARRRSREASVEAAEAEAELTSLGGAPPGEESPSATSTNRRNDVAESRDGSPAAMREAS